MNASGYPMKMRVQRDFSSDEEGDSAADSEEDMITHFPINLHGVQGSTNGRAALLLEENMAHIHALQEDIQKMRSITAGRRLVEKTVQRRYTRLSTSCPSLNQDSDDDSWPADAALPAIQITANDSVGSNMASESTAAAGGPTEDGRQPSSCWSPRERRQAAAADAATGRLRNSVSLSSLDSDQEESGRCHRPSPRNHDEKRLGVSTTGISSSTQDLRSSAVSSVSDAQSKRSRSSVGDTRIKIQKSLSTPSILGSRDGTEVDSGKLSRGLLSNESDEDDERPELLVHTAPAETFVRDPSFLEDGRKQRRKRSSIFFRKKKDKEKAKKSTQSLTLLQRGSQAVASGRWLNNNSTNSTGGAANALGPPKVSPPITDFGRSKSASDMEDPLLQYDTSNFPDTFDPPVAILSDCSVDDPDLRLLDEESEAWSGSVDRKILKALTEKQIKRQEHVYEFIMTEKHHCVTLKVMQRIFADGMQRELGYSVEMIQRLFPRLDDLLSVHMTFLRHLRQRQRQALYVEQFGDLLLRDFAGEIGDNMRSCYGEFCSKHTESVALYKELLKSDRRFQEFIRRCSFNPLLKKKGVPECILFVTHRVTKYPLLIEPLIKTSRDREDEITHLTKALQLVKEILVDVNSQVAEKQKEARLLEVYNKIEAKSTAFYRGNKFKKSDLLSANRKLMFEGSAALMQARGRPLPVQVVVMSDVVFFLQESNQKYHFVSQDGKAGIVSLQRLLVRDRAGGDSRGIYLISNVNEPGMYEMDCTMPRDKRIWIEAISDAVKRCPYDVEETGEGDESRQQAEAQAVQVRQLSKLLRDKDLQLALLCEDKLRVQADLVELLAPQESRLQASVGFMARSYTHLVQAGLESTDARHMLSTAIQEAARLATVVFPVSGSLSRSASSVGEHHSNHYVSPALPKRAETFAGFDNNTTPVKRRVPHEDGIEEEEGATGDAVLDPGEDAAPAAGNSSSPAAAVPSEQLQPRSPAETQQPVDVEVRSETYHVAAVQLHHSLSTMLCLIAQTASNVDVLRSCLPADVGVGAGGTGESRLGVKLEELRNLQDRFTKEKTEWSRERDNQDKWIQDKRTELAKLQDQLREEQSDVARQRELLYRQLDALRSQGILLSPNLQVVTVPQPEGTLPPAAAPGSPPAVGAVAAGEEGGLLSSSGSRSSVAAVSSGGSHVKLKSSSSMVRRGGGSGGDGGGGSQPALPAHLLSSINQQKAAVTSQPAPRQELPMKLAKLSSSLSAPATASALASTSSASAAAPPAPAERRSVMTSPPNTTSSAAAAAPAGSSVQQMLPMKLSQEQRAAATSRGYQRLASGAPATTAGEPSPQRQQAQRTNTYPKMPCRPTPPRRPATTTVTTLVTHSSTATPSPPRPPPRQPQLTPPTPASTNTSNQDSEEIMFF